MQEGALFVCSSQYVNVPMKVAPFSGALYKWRSECFASEALCADVIPLGEWALWRECDVKHFNRHAIFFLFFLFARICPQSGAFFFLAVYNCRRWENNQSWLLKSALIGRREGTTAGHC